MAKKKRKLPRIRLKLVTWIALWLMAFLLPLAWRRVSQPQQTEAAWWNDAWHYRQRVDVTNNTSEEANVYIALTLDTSDTTKFQANCGDLRFTKQNGQVLEYYLVSGCGTASTSVHVQFDTFPAGAQSIYAYYGNAAAEDGFASADFSTEASNYTIGGVASEEVGPGPVAYWKFDEGSGSTAFDSASYGLGEELLIDGDMEAADTSAWNAGNSAILTKETTDPHGGSQVLRVAYNGSNYPYARQFLTEEGKTYRITGYARSDGSARPRIRSYASPVWVGTSSTDWQAIDVTITSFGNQVWLEGMLASAGYVEFDDVSIREVVSGNNGTISGATWANEDQCVKGKCLSFDGVDDRGIVPDANDLDVADSSFTVSGWLKADSTQTDLRFVLDHFTGGTPGSGWAITVGANSALAFSHRSNGDNLNLQSQTTVRDDQWHFFTVAISGTDAWLYIDGELENSATYSGSLVATSSSLNFGGLESGYDFKGYLDEVKIFPYALSEDQIKTEYNLGSATVIGEAATVAPPPNGTLKDSLVAHWSFDEQAGQTVHDKVGGNDGTRGADANAGSDDPTWKPASDCKVNGCLDFATGDYANFGDPGDGSLDVGTGDFSMSAWVKTSDSTVWKFVQQKGATSVGSNGYSWSIEIDGRQRLRISNGAYRSEVNSSTAISDGNWHYLAVSADRDGNATFYVDGRPDGKVDISQSAGDASTSIPFYVSRMESNNQFIGLIDEVKIYNAALTADQIKQDMNAGAAIVYGVTAREADELSDGAGDPPIAEWKFDEKQGTTAYDTSGNENNGTVNGATWKSACKQGACLEFDGSSTVNAGNTASLKIDENEDFTLEAWIKVASNAEHGIISKDTGGDRGYNLRTDDSGTIFLRVGSVLGTSPSVNYYDDKWHHLVSVVDRDGLATYYFDGRAIGTMNVSASSSEKMGDSTATFIGAGTSGSTQYMSGLIDHVKIYDYARTPAQIAYDYNRGKPIAHWKFDECEGTVAHDSSGNDNHGTINIGATGSQTSAGTCQTSGAWGNGASGKFNGSLNFDGTDDYVDVGSDSSIDIDGKSFSVSAWVKKTKSAINEYFLSKGDEAGVRAALHIGFKNTDDIRFGFYGDDLDSNSTITDTHWHNLVFTYNVSDNSRKIYIDGKLDNSGTAGGSLSGTDDDNWGIGRREFTDSLGFSGRIDDVRIYNYALSPAQVQKVMNEGMAVRYGPVSAD
jgi:hypothetical protein